MKYKTPHLYLKHKHNYVQIDKKSCLRLGLINIQLQLVTMVNNMQKELQCASDSPKQKSLDLLNLCVFVV